MEIVIGIPDHYYENNIKKELPIILSENNVIAILPKGHGRLIDADDIDNHIIGHVDTRSCPTIIEADGGVK